MNLEVGVEVVIASFNDGVVCSAGPADEPATGVPAATGKLDEPADTVDVAVAAVPPAACLHAKRTARTPFGPLK